MKRRIYQILENPAPDDKVARFISLLIVAVILGNVAAVILQSVSRLDAEFHEWFTWFEDASIVLFTAEYLLRVWVCTEDEQFRSPVRGRLRFAFTPLALIDLLVILPFYLPLVTLDLRVMRGIRLLRVSRLLKFGRYSTALRLVGRVVRSRRQELVASLLILAVLLVIASTLIYEVEHAVQPGKFPNIVAAMYFEFSALTTAAYGDIVPVTPVGKVLQSVIAVLGIGLFALPTGILGAGFVEELQTRKAQLSTCPHCGKKLS